MSDGRGLAASAASSNSALNALTIDLEDWFHICGVETLAPRHWDTLPSRITSPTEWLLDLLDHRQIRATFFVVGWIAERHPELVQKIARAGHEIGSHSYWHRRAYELDRQAFADDVAASCRAVAATGAAPLTAYRAPEWSINESSIWALDELVHLGFRVDASMAPLKLVGSVTFPRQPHVRETAHGPIVEVPPLVADRFGQVMPLGWGWGLRMSSPLACASCHWHVERRRSAGRAHDSSVGTRSGSPRVTLPLRLYFAHYFRMGGFRERLSTILAGASFGPISTLSRGNAVTQG